VWIVLRVYLRQSLRLTKVEMGHVTTRLQVDIEFVTIILEYVNILPYCTNFEGINWGGGGHFTQITYLGSHNY